MNKELYRVEKDSEEFLKGIGADNYRMVNVLEFMKLVSENNLEGRVGVRDFELGQTSLTQVYVELNGEYIYSTTIN
jgi:hypothetical protein